MAVRCPTGSHISGRLHVRQLTTNKTDSKYCVQLHRQMTGRSPEGCGKTQTPTKTEEKGRKRVHELIAGTPMSLPSPFPFPLPAASREVRTVWGEAAALTVAADGVRAALGCALAPPEPAALGQILHGGGGGKDTGNRSETRHTCSAGDRAPAALQPTVSCYLQLLQKRLPEGC
jgi:hypothetical protein